MSLHSPCPREETLAAYQEGKLPPNEAEVVERHALACPSCQNLLWLSGQARTASGLPVPPASLARLRGLTPARHAWGWKQAVAAALLMAAGAAWVRVARLKTSQGTSSSLEAPRVAAPSRQPFPQGILGNPEHPSACLSTGVDLLLDKGCRVLSTPSRRGLRPEKGRLWLEVTQGEDMILELPGAAVSLGRGLVQVSLASPAPSVLGWLVHDASAGEDEDVEATLCVLEGSVELKTGTRTLKAGAGAKLLLSAHHVRQEPLPGTEAEAIRGDRTMAVANLPGPGLVAPMCALTPANPSVRMSGDPRPRYRWVTLLTDRSPSTEVGLAFPIAGGWYQWPAGLASLPPRAREGDVIEIVWDGERLTGRINGCQALRMDREEVSRRLIPAGSPGWSISAWGGKVSVAYSTLHPSSESP